jgi:tetratricopeptide (TPR) repeat protein
VLAVTGDGQLGRDVRARFHLLDDATLDRIQWTSQMEALAPEYADLAGRVILDRAVEPDARTMALHAARFLTLNEGRPGESLRLSRLKLEVEGNLEQYHHNNLVYALFWEGDSAAGRVAAQQVGEGLDLDLWRLWQGDTTGMSREQAALIRHTLDVDHDRSEALFLIALHAVLVGQPAAGRWAAVADSVAVEGCCGGSFFGNLIVARLYERLGDLPAALRALRRQRGWYAPVYLSTALREEGRIAAMIGERAEAIESYRAYLRLRAHAEPAAGREIERVRADLAHLEHGG